MKKTGQSENKIQRQPARTMRRPKLVTNAQLPSKIPEVSKLQKKETLRKPVQITEKNTTHRKQSSSAEKDNLDYNKAQTINGKDRKVI